MVRFKNRREAGQKLAQVLKGKYLGQDCVVLAIPRGGVVLGKEIAEELGAPLDLVITRKVGHPNNPEYAICVVAEDGHKLCNATEVQQIDRGWLERQIEAERQEAKRRREVYLRGRRRIDLRNKTAILVDDGIATGMTFEVAIEELRQRQPKRLVAAVPVVPVEGYDKLKAKVDDFVALAVENNFLGAVGAYYDDFPQVEDEEVVKLLQF